MFSSLFKLHVFRGAWVAQLVKCLNLDFSSGHDLRDMKLNPAWVSVAGMEPA